MIRSDLIELMHARLCKQFMPSHIEIKDDSSQHVGHVGNKGGGHFTLIISSLHFKNKKRLDVHREIYAELNDLMHDEIHALKIKIV